MSRCGNMGVLDDVERLLAKNVFHLDTQEKLVDGMTSKVKSKVLIVKCGLDPLLQQSSVQLVEDDAGAGLNLVTLTNLDPDTLVLKPDHFGVHYFKRKTYNKACDYLVLTKFQGERYAIFIDLKTVVAEDQNLGDSIFRWEEDYDAEIVWQMIGADAIFDGLEDVIAKKALDSQSSPKANKVLSSRGELAKFKRRYIILYGHVDTSGESVCQSTSFQQPNINILEKPVHVLQVPNNKTVALGSLFSVGSLER